MYRDQAGPLKSQRMEKDPGIAELAQECGRVRKQRERQRKMGPGRKRATEQGGGR